MAAGPALRAAEDASGAAADASLMKPVSDAAVKPAATDSGADLDVFLENAVDQPGVSGEALLRLLKGKDKKEIWKFKREFCGQISMLLASLDSAVETGKLGKDSYSDITGRLAEMRIPSKFAHDGAFGFHADPRAKDKAGGEDGPDPLDALVRVNDAKKKGDPRATERAIDEAVQTFPENVSLQVAAASSYNELKKYKQAEATATNAITLNSRSADGYKARAVARASLEDRKGAIEDIKKAMEINPQDESARVLSALLESRKSAGSLKSVASVEEVKRALGAAEESGGITVAGGQSAPGLSAAAAAAALSAPDYSKSKAYLKTAMAKARLGDYQGAVHYAGLAIEKDPSNAEAYLERANANNFLGKYDDAVRDAGAVIEKDPSNLQAFNIRAWALNRKGEAGGAADDASKAIGLNPNFADAWYNRALAYESQGDYKRMLEDIKQAAALSSAYSARYQDAVAQYGGRVQGFGQASAYSGAAARGTADGGVPADAGRSPLRRFLMTLFFTLTGGGLVAAGLIHIMTSRAGAGRQSGRATHPDVLSPSVFYEGVATGKYKIERKLGEGAMGVVYEATDQSLGRKVAIKKMGEEIKVNEREKQRFLDEARTVALLHHPHIVEIYTIFEEEDNIYLVFEHVDGGTLDRVVDKEARIGFDKALRMFGEIAGALSYAHSKNVIHRDLKLANIMLSNDGDIKVMDFGLAHQAMQSMARMSNGEVVGSPAYMAPEQALGVSSAESDIYSLGVCLYESLSGVLPFQGPDFNHQKTHLAYQKLTDMVPGLPAGVDAVVAKCLAPAPEDRYHSAEEFRQALNALV